MLKEKKYQPAVIASVFYKLLKVMVHHILKISFGIRLKKNNNKRIIIFKGTPEHLRLHEFCDLQVVEDEFHSVLYCSVRSDSLF